MISKTSRVVVCTADVGCGHGRAAAAVTLALRAIRPAIDVHVLDALATTPTWFNLFYRDAYLFGAKHLPRLNGWFYNISDRGGPADGGANLASFLEARALANICQDPHVASADIIICTHFLCARVFSRLRAIDQRRARLAVVITDQHPHAVWRVRNADLYIVASDATAQELICRGVDRNRITVTGIPIDSRFDTPVPKLIARRKHKLPEDRQIILITGGGLGLGGLDQALEGALSVPDDHFSVVVCGSNTRLYTRLLSRHGNSRRCRIIGHTSRMHELMSAADLLVGKPGGLTTTEAATMGLPMVLLRPLPGQEEHNATTTVRAGMAVLHYHPFEAGQAAANLVRDPQRLQTMRFAAAKFARSDSARSAALAAMSLLYPPAPHVQHDSSISVPVN